MRRLRLTIAVAFAGAVLSTIITASPAFGTTGLGAPSAPSLTLINYLEVKVAWTDNASIEDRFVIYHKPPTRDWEEWKVVVDDRTGQPQATGWTVSTTGSLSRTGDHCFAVAARTDNGLVALGLARCVFVDESATVRVPNVLNVSRQTAETRVRTAGLVPSFTSSGDLVISQNPASGSWVWPGSAVAMGLRSGPLP
jgi:hypothetical protein